MAQYDIGTTTGLSNDEIAQSIIRGSGSAFGKLKQAATRRVDLVMLGDSNQEKGGYGFTKGLDENLSGRYGQYASPIYDSRATSIFQGLFAQSGQSSTFSDTVEPNHADMFLAAETTTTGGTENTGVIVNSSVDKFDITSNIRYWLRWGSFDSGSGAFKMRVRLEESPYSSLATSPSNILTNKGEFGYELSHIDIAQGAADGTINIKGGLAGNVTITPPMTFFYYRAEDLLKDSGISCHTLHAVGGASLWDFAEQIKSYSDNQLTNYFNEVRRLQLAKGQDPIVVVYINSGLNDRNETETTSQGAYGFSDSTSPKGYIDNLTSIIDRVEHIWAINGWAHSELQFLTIASHVIADPNDSQLTGYRGALTSLAEKRQNLVTVDLSTLMTAQDAIDGGWYLNDVTEREHLTTDGYNAVSSLITSLLD